MCSWYKHNYRRTLLDMHIEDWDEQFFSKFDPRDYFEKLKIAEITAPMIYVQSHVGLCYWPTQSGRMHRGFLGKEDQIRRLFDLCHEAGMDVVLYYSIIYNNVEYERHPEWRMRDHQGRSSRDHGGRYGLCCPNHEGYRAFVKEQIKEFCEYFDFEGVFFDMTFWPEVCYCDSCRKKFVEKYDYEIPHIVDWRDDRWKAFNEERHQWIGEFADMLTAEVKKYRPEVSVEHQYGNSLSFWRFGNNENVSKASDYIGTDLYGGIHEQSFACKTWYNLTKNQPFQYMTSRCYPTLAEHTTTKSFDRMRQCVAMTFLHHGASLLIDAIDPAGTTDGRVYEMFGRIYGEMKAYEPYMDKGEMAYDVSLYFDLNGKMNIEENGYDVLDHALDRDASRAGTMPHFDALMGAARGLSEHHIPYSVINNWKFEEMWKHKVLVLADVPDMPEEYCDLVLDYLLEGGNVYISGHSAPYLVKAVFGTETQGLTKERITYMAPAEGSRIMQGLFTKEYPMVMFDKAVIMPKEAQGEVLAHLVLPYTVPGIAWSMFPTDIKEHEYIDIKGDAYPFATIHANPPGIWTEYPAMLKKSVGKGTVIWSALPIEKAERYQHSEIFAGIIRELASDDFLFGGDAPETVEYILFDDHKNARLLMGIIEKREENRIPKTHDITVWVKTPAKPEAVKRIPDGRRLAYTYENGRVTVKLDEIDIFTMIAIELGDALDV